MNADQLVDGIGKAVSATRPTQEYCFLWIDHWSTCMTKSEWSGWMQAIGTFAAIVFALTLPYIQSKFSQARTYFLAKQGVAQMFAICVGLTISLENGVRAKDALAQKNEELDLLLGILQEVRIEELTSVARPLWWTAQSNARNLVALRDKVGADAGFKIVLEQLERNALTCLAKFNEHEPRILGIRASRLFGLAV